MEVLEKEKIMGLIARGAVHDINNVLTAIIGYTDILLFNKSCMDCRNEIEIIKKAALDGIQIARRIKDFSRSGEISREIFDICEAVEAARVITMPMWHNYAQTRGKNITLNYTRTEPIYVYGNESELREVLANMIINSIDAIEQNGQIQIDVLKHEEQAIIKIRDNGTGMTEEVKNNIFNPYFTTKRENGSGLGLSTAIKAIKEMGGNIEVESKFGEGTEFRIILPKLDVNQKKEKEIKKFNSKYELKVLVIDDQIEICSVLTEMLSRIISGKIDTCSRGKDALELIDKNNYDIVVTDISMPDISGLDIIENIRKSTPETKIIAMTGWNGFLNKNENIKPDGILSKPFTMEELEEIVDTIYKTGSNLVV